MDDEVQRRLREDEKLLRHAERALSEIKIAHGLSDPHASVLAALRIRLKGDPGKNLEDLLEAAGDLGKGPSLDSLMDTEEKPKRSLDDMLAEKPKPKPEWPGS
ncbi:MAG TPA: heavy metal-associated domain-containing protein [Actinomycetota bacterium]